MGRDVFGEVNRMIVSVPVNPVTALLLSKSDKKPQDYFKERSHRIRFAY